MIQSRREEYPMLHQIEIPCWITKPFILKHSELTFIYSTDATYSNRTWGQAKEAMGLFNTIPCPTKFRDPCDKESAFFADSKMFLIEALWDKVFKTAKSFDKPIICFPNMGTGGAELPTRAPQCYALLKDFITKYQHPLIKWL